MFDVCMCVRVRARVCVCVCVFEFNLFWFLLFLFVCLCAVFHCLCVVFQSQLLLDGSLSVRDDNVTRLLMTSHDWHCSPTSLASPSSLVCQLSRLTLSSVNSHLALWSVSCLA